MRQAIPIFVTAVGALAVCTAMPTSAENYPAKRIRIVTPYAPGGTADIMARLVSQRLTEVWGQPVVVENRPGASGMIGAGLVAKAPPDGYTLLAAYVTEIAIVPGLYPNASYDPVKDFDPISVTALTPMILIVKSVAARGYSEGSGEAGKSAAGQDRICIGWRRKPGTPGG